MGLAPLSPRSGAAPLIGMAGSPSHSWPVDKDHVFPTDCPRRQLEGWEPPFLGGTARREQWVMRAGGLLQGCETLGSSGSLPWAGEGVLAVLTAQLGWEKVWTSWQSNNPPQILPFPSGSVLWHCKSLLSALQTHRAASACKAESGTLPYFSFPSYKMGHKFCSMRV